MKILFFNKQHLKVLFPDIIMDFCRIYKFMGHTMYTHVHTRDLFVLKTIHVIKKCVLIKIAKEK